jgi:hypothetical protein
MPTQRITDSNGWFEVKRNPLSRVGVFPYRGASLGLEGPDADKVVRVYRPESELSSPECLESFKLLPWVDEHTLLGPDEGQTPAEAKGVHGVIGENVFYDSGVVYGNIKAFSNSLGRLIEAGKKQLSAGYRCVYDWTAGTFNGQPYDCVQRQIRGNHLALVQEGRMGPSVAVMDSLTFTFDAQEAIPMDPEKKDGEGEMTLTQIAALVKSFGPQIAAINAAIASLGQPAAAAAPGATDGTPPAAAATEEKPEAAAAADKVAAAAMDAALAPIRTAVDALTKSVATMDAALQAMPAKLATDTAARDKLATRLGAHVGTFDAADKTLSQVAAYGCEKLGLKPPAGSELVAVESYLTAAEKAPSAVVRTGLDAAPVAAGSNFVSRHVAGEAAK